MCVGGCLANLGLVLGDRLPLLPGLRLRGPGDAVAVRRVPRELRAALRSETD